MKYLKKFNEELNPRTYRSAAHKITKGKLYDYQERSKKLKEWADVQEENKNMERWRTNIEDCKKNGILSLEITNPETGDKMSGNFYPLVIFDPTEAEEAREEILDGKDSFFWIPIGIVPENVELLEECMEFLPDPEFGNGFFWGLSVGIDFKVEEDSVVLKAYELTDYDDNVSGNITIKDRKSANNFKKALVDYFSEDRYYDVINHIHFLYDLGFDIKNIGDYIKKLPISKIITKRES